MISNRMNIAETLNFLIHNQLTNLERWQKLQFQPIKIKPMRIKHTPGQWGKRASLSSDFHHIRYITDEDGNEIAKIRHNLEQSQKEALANAQLIAKAPELLQMVNDLKNCIQRLTSDNLTQSKRDLESEWVGNAHELLHNINPDYNK